ncbi:hypothetical protein WH96_20190 [Kiloniella spongiae]|uniref:Squalene cyclase C-terminal domain-containing protein n=1 Tax=Kiloniella spongiae TaxID=1489064 RepID=A0A0H2ME89_9PROT|nr:hypothetical protein [Kiloniella spongiae]KLN58947.1 hypothetical protein WH96_20190 [Kiloniella spongiae]
MQYPEDKLLSAPPFQPTQIREDVAVWLDRLQHGLALGRFAFCERGNLVPTKGVGAYMPSVFAMKIAWQIGIWDKWPQELRTALVEFISSAQGNNGYFVDPWLRKQTRPNWRDWAKIALGRNKYEAVRAYYSEWDARNIRAETRQNISTLLMVGVLPKFSPPFEISGYSDTWAFLNSLDWSSPWGSGSHLSHQIMLTVTNEKLKTIEIDTKEIKRAIFDFLQEIYHEKDGTWFKGDNVSNVMRINGAMKILSGLQWVDHPFKKHDRLIDLVLSEPFYSDGCHFTNSLFVLHQVIRLQGRGYRQDEIDDRARKAARCLMLHKKKNSGFSFHRNKAQVGYYTAKVSKGFDEADVHGTVMYVWACAIIIEMLKEEYSDEAKIWRIHLP